MWCDDHVHGKKSTNERPLGCIPFGKVKWKTTGLCLLWQSKNERPLGYVPFSIKKWKTIGLRSLWRYEMRVDDEHIKYNDEMNDYSAASPFAPKWDEKVWWVCIVCWRCVMRWICMMSMYRIWLVYFELFICLWFIAKINFYYTPKLVDSYFHLCG
jgi:hypothetical protein